MKRFVFIVEGETEESFVNEVLALFFNSKGIYNHIQCFKIKHSNGGVSKYSHIKKDIINIVYENDVIVTTMFDFYRLPSSFPGFNRLNNNMSHYEQVSFLENEMKNDIEKTQNRNFNNFIPYIQLHEFETLIFSSINGIESIYEKIEFDYTNLKKIFEIYDNPEDINNGPNTSPSMRLKKYIPGYVKNVFGIEIVKEIGMETILQKCPKFREWINKLLDSIK
ncbi:MAG: DUF4276 family protein [Bacteroidales bacterium]|nr:DUF4276 family protein [Bacteroidales bacterium]